MLTVKPDRKRRLRWRREAGHEAICCCPWSGIPEPHAGVIPLFRVLRAPTTPGRKAGVFAMIRLSAFSSATFSRGVPRWREGLWWLCRSLFFAPWFPVPSAVKAAVLRFFGAKVGSGVVIRSRVNITFPWRFECGDHVWIGDEVMILSLDRVVLGSHVCLSQRAFLCTGSHDFTKESFDLVTGPIVIGDGCWVGAQSFIGPGVRMAAASRCLAGAVVARDVPPGATVAGVPARRVDPSSAG